VVAVVDGPRLSLAGRVVPALAALLALSSSASTQQPGTTGTPPAELAVQAPPQRPHGILGGRVLPAKVAARPGNRNRRGDALVGVPAAALAGTVVAGRRRSRTTRSRPLERRRPAFGPRAPPLPA